MNKLARIHILSNTEMLKPLRQFVCELKEKISCTQKNIEDLRVALNEACMNVIQHAYKNRNDEEIVIEFWVNKNTIEIKVIDSADAVDIESIKSRALDDVRPGGLGVHFIHQVMDSVEYKNNTNGKGNVLVMRKALEIIDD